MFEKGLILLNIVLFILSLTLFLTGGMFGCSASYIGQFYGNISSAGSFILLIFLHVILIHKKHNDKLPLSAIPIFVSPILSILSILLTSYNTKKYRTDIINKKANSKYYIYNAFYGISLVLIILLQITYLIVNHFYENMSNNFIASTTKNMLLIMSIINCIMSYMSHRYLVL